MPVSTSPPLTANPGPNGAPNWRPSASSGLPVKPMTAALSLGRTAQRVAVAQTLSREQILIVISPESARPSQWVESTSHSSSPRLILANVVTVSVVDARFQLSTTAVVSIPAPCGR